MKLRVTGKLFLGIFFTSILVALAMGWAFRYSLQEGFADYVRKSEAQRIATIAETLGENYAETGSWKFLSDDPRALWRLMRPMGSGSHGQAPGKNDELSNDSRSRDTNTHRGDRENSNPPLPRGLWARLWITDTQNNVITGNGELPAGTTATPIVVLDQTVGWIRSATAPFPGQATDAHFVEQQIRATWWIAGLSALLAALVSVLLARLFLAPVKRVAAATHELAAGNFHVQVPVTSSDEIGQLARDFNLLANTLDKNEALRRNFMADVSHELRTPLAVLRGELEALQDGVRKPTPDTLGSLQAEVATLSKLVDDLYQLSLADVGALTYRKTNVQIFSLLQQAVGIYRERLKNKGITLQVDLPEHDKRELFGDAERLMQLFNNLLENTLRYTDAPGTLRIGYRYQQNMLYLDFQDSSPGVSNEALPKLFERLFRMDPSRSRASGGSGLGLTICQSIVQAHDGTITARQSPLGGLWMEVCLPLAK